MKSRIETITVIEGETTQAEVLQPDWAKTVSRTVAAEGLVICGSCGEKFPRRDIIRKRKCPKCKSPLVSKKQRSGRR